MYFKSLAFLYLFLAWKNNKYYIFYVFVAFFIQH